MMRKRKERDEFIETRDTAVDYTDDILEDLRFSTLR